jgi:ligand-binding sensor domain-containing protein
MDSGLDVVRFMSVFEDRDGVLWLGTEARGVVRFSEGAFESVPTPEDALGRPVDGFAQSTDGTVWAAGHAGPIAWRDGVPRIVAVDPPRAEPGVRGIAIDGEDRVWVATAGGPACVSGPCPEASEPNPDLGSAHAITLGAGDDLLTLSPRGFGAGPAGRHELRLSFDDGSWTGGLLFDPDKDRTWFSRLGSLFVSTESGFERVELPGNNPGYPIRSMLLDREGALWVGTDGGWTGALSSHRGCCCSLGAGS